VARGRCCGRLPLFFEARGGDGVSRGGSATNGRKRGVGGLGWGSPWGHFIGRRGDMDRPMGDPRAPTHRVMLTLDAHRASPFGAFLGFFCAGKEGKIIAMFR